MAKLSNRICGGASRQGQCMLDITVRFFGPGTHGGIKTMTLQHAAVP